jgi:hypothetical protein
MGGKRLYFLLCMMGAAHLSGCASNALYYWGAYEQGLYGRYVNEEHAQADSTLFAILSDAEQQQLKVPPGVYADYGFALFKRGDANGAIVYFEKEKWAFPEATIFMDKLIDKVRQKNAGLMEKQPQTQPAIGAKP